MISIIVPVYNVEQYLELCVNSLTSQTIKDIEILLVDDGSTDSSADICDSLAKRDNRIKVIHKENGGLMSAWKCGVLNSKGEYIGFVDSDDEIDCEMYERLLVKALQNDADIVACGLLREYENRTEKENFYLEGGLYEKKEIQEKIFPILVSNGTMLNRGLSPNRVTKLFKREIILSNLNFCDERVSLGEDLVTTFSCMCDVKRIFIVTDFFPYHYKIRKTSIMGSFNPKFFEQALLLSDVLRNIAEKKSVYDFSKQLDNDLVSLTYYGMEKSALSGCNICYIKKFADNNEFKKAFSNEELYKNNIKCRVYRMLLKLKAYGLMRLIAVMVAKKRRMS